MDSKLGQASLPDRMLGLLEEGGIHSTAELARRLGTTETLVAALAEDLTRHGYLAPIASDCGAACRGCWAAGTCSHPEPVFPTLALTPRGRQASRRVR